MPPPTDHEFNDFPPDIERAVKKLEQDVAERLDLPAGLQAVFDRTPLTPLEATIHAELDEAYADALTQGMDAERIEDFRPTGLLNLPDVEVTFSGTYDAAPTDAMITAQRVLADVRKQAARRASMGSRSLALWQSDYPGLAALLKAVDGGQ